MSVVCQRARPKLNRKGIAYKRLDGQCYLCDSNLKPMIVSQKDLMDPTKYIVTQVDSLMTLYESNMQAWKWKREQEREEVKKQKLAKMIAEEKRQEWLKDTYLDIIRSAR